MRIAFFSPLNPVNSGISDYSEELLPYLAEHCEIELVLDGYQPTTPGIAGQFRVHSPESFLAQRSRFDTVIYQIGNNYRCHAYMLPCMAQVPGISVIHDYSLTYLMLAATAERGDLETLRRIIEPSHGAKTGGHVRRILLGTSDPYEVSLARPIVEMSSGVIVHNLHSFKRLQAEFPGKRMARILHATPIRDLPEVGPLRDRYGIARDALVLGSLSTLAYNKRIFLLLEALREVKPKYPNLQLLLVGPGELDERTARLIREFGLESTIRRTGWLEPDEYLDHIALVDIVVDFRYPTAGETSGSALRALQAAKPMLVSAEGFFWELPDGACIRIPVGGDEVAQLITALDRLLSSPEIRAQMGQAGRDYTLENLRREQAAEAYFRFAEEVVAAGPAPIKPWRFPAHPANLTEKVVSAIYKAGRVNYFHRNYGWKATWKRVRGGQQRGKQS